MIVGIFAKIVSEKDGKIELDFGAARVRVFDAVDLVVEERECETCGGLAKVILDLDIGPFEIVDGMLHAASKH